MKLITLIFLLFTILNIPTCDVPKQTAGKAVMTDSLALIFKHKFDTIKVENINQAEAQYIDETFEKLYKQGRFNGAVLVAEKGKVFYRKVFGVNDQSKKDNLELSSAFQLASVSKMFTALSIMQLKEKGKLSYDHDVRYFLPDFPYDGITIRDLLTHQSGLPNYMAVSDKYWDQNIPLSNQAMYELMAKYKPKLFFKPGSRFNYSNTNYAFLALIVEKLSHMPFNEYVEKNIFKPAGMVNSFVFNPCKECKNEVIGYNRCRRGYSKIPKDYLNGVWGDKGIYATVEDMYRFDMALKYNILVKSESIEEAFTPFATQNKRNPVKFYGFGWRIKYLDEQKIVYHFGWWKGFKTGYLKNMSRDITLIILNNTNSFPNHEIVWGLLNYPYKLQKGS
jgi:CubicO group peptidase (beta-lactamase class C family)